MFHEYRYFPPPPLETEGILAGEAAGGGSEAVGLQILASWCV